uniref:carboxypeptidase-like regulatory domain-containing protein n=1 Tax=Candidatus Electrothrix sp. TaxID=2170559 RepID=UPI0040565C47
PVKLALNNRDIDPGDMSLVQMADTLLLSLRQSGGFTINEIRFNTLELEEYRRRLLICIGIKINENTTYQQLEQLIVEYQNDNCGEQESPCSVTEVTGTVLDPSGKPLTGARVVTENKEHDTTTDLNGTFSLDLGEPGQTLVISFPGFQTQKLKVCNDSELDIVLQNVREFSGAIVNPNLIETSEVVKILERRGVNITGAENREKALMSLESSERGNSFTKEELQLLKNKTLKKVLEKEEVTFAANDNKDVLVRKLMRG